MAQGIHTALRIKRDDARQQLQERIDQGKHLFPVPIRSADDFNKAAVLEKKWGSYNIELLSRIYNTDQYVREYGTFVVNISEVADRYFSPALDTYVSRLTLSINSQVASLESLIERIELLDEASANNGAEATTVEMEAANPATGKASPASSPAEVLTLKPTIYGVGVDLKEIGRRIRRWFQRREGKPS